MDSHIDEQKRLQLLWIHIHHVEDNCKIIADALIHNSEFELAKELMRNAHIHDASKFEGIEWEHLNGWRDPLFPEAIKHHVTTNPHHPEYWGSIHEMKRIYIPEMISDWSARNSEMRTTKSLIQWIEEEATQRYNFSPTDKIYKEIYHFLNLLLEPAFT